MDFTKESMEELQDRKAMLESKIDRIRRAVYGYEFDFFDIITDEEGKVDDEKLDCLVNDLLDCDYSSVTYNEKTEYTKMWRSIFKRWPDITVSGILNKIENAKKEEIDIPDQSENNIEDILNRYLKRSKFSSLIEGHKDKSREQTRFVGFQLKRMPVLLKNQMELIRDGQKSCDGMENSKRDPFINRIMQEGK